MILSGLSLNDDDVCVGGCCIEMIFVDPTVYIAQISKMSEMNKSSMFYRDDHM